MLRQGTNLIKRYGIIIVEWVIRPVVQFNDLTARALRLALSAGSPAFYGKPFRALLILALGRLARASFPSYNTTNAATLANSQILNDPFPYYFPQENASATRRDLRLWALHSARAR